MSSPTTITRGGLIALLTESYTEFKRMLARRLGSTDAAADVLHETYLRLQRVEGALELANPHAYLVRIALNTAADHAEAEKRLLTPTELAELLAMGDDQRNPEAAAVARSELELFESALSELPARSQSILIAARIDELPHDAIARRFGISTRMVHHELRRALEHCANRLQRKVVPRFGPRPKKNQDE